MNSWPKGHRHAMTQEQHYSWNSHNYPGTLQLCSKCDEPTGNCEDDSIYLDNGEGPLCGNCYMETDEYEGV